MIEQIKKQVYSCRESKKEGNSHYKFRTSHPEYNRLSNTLNFNFLIEVFVNLPSSNQGKPYPEAPIVFIKLPSTISGKNNYSYSLFICSDHDHSFRNFKTLASTYDFLITLFLQLDRGIPIYHIRWQIYKNYKIRILAL